VMAMAGHFRGWPGETKTLQRKPLSAAGPISEIISMQIREGRGR
jgi:hypothetical protein